jgi:hypothetical protein
VVAYVGGWQDWWSATGYLEIWIFWGSGPCHLGTDTLTLASVVVLVEEVKYTPPIVE